MASGFHISGFLHLEIIKMALPHFLLVFMVLVFHICIFGLWTYVQRNDLGTHLMFQKGMLKRMVPSVGLLQGVRPFAELWAKQV